MFVDDDDHPQVALGGKRRRPGADHRRSPGLRCGPGPVVGHRRHPGPPQCPGQPGCLGVLGHDDQARPLLPPLRQPSDDGAQGVGGGRQPQRGHRMLECCGHHLGDLGLGGGGWRTGGRRVGQRRHRPVRAGGGEKRCQASGPAPCRPAAQVDHLGRRPVTGDLADRLEGHAVGRGDVALEHPAAHRAPRQRNAHHRAHLEWAVGRVGDRIVERPPDASRLGQYPNEPPLGRGAGLSRQRGGGRVREPNLRLPEGQPGLVRVGCGPRAQSPRAERRSSARLVSSQVNPSPVRPKWP